MSREEAIDIILNSTIQIGRCNGKSIFADAINTLLDTERKTGKWIDSHTTCSECGWQMIDDVMESPNIVEFNYCPNCGARMESEK